jgi:hypothetical protein
LDDSDSSGVWGIGSIGNLGLSGVLRLYRVTVEKFVGSKMRLELRVELHTRGSKEEVHTN